MKEYIRRYVIDEKLDNINTIINDNRRNKYIGASKKKKEQEKIKEYIKDTSPIKEYPIKIRCNWYIKNSNADLDNKSIKSILDTLQAVGVLKNDNIKHITRIEHKAIKSDDEKVEVFIYKE